MDSESSKKEKFRLEKFEEPLEMPGKIFLAEIHGSAQRLLKVKKLSKYIRFCQCCLLPSETPGVVMPYTCLDNRKDFGIGIHLYFSYIIFCISIIFVSFCLSSIPTMVFSIRYTNHLKDHCNKYYNIENNLTTNNTNEINDTNIFIQKKDSCKKYLSSSQSIKEDLSSIIQTDWILRMSTDNLKNYYEIFNGKEENINDILIDFSFLYFLTSLVLLIINFLFIHYINLISDKEDFEETTPKDFTIFVHGVKRPKDNKKITRKEHLRNLLNEISNNYFKLEIHDIIPCYKLNQLYKLTKVIFEDRVKIYHAHNFKKQRDLHEKYMKSKMPVNYHYTIPLKGMENKNDNNYFKGNDTQMNSQLSMIVNKGNNINNNNLNQNIQNDNNLNYYTKYLWYIKATPIKEIEDRIKKNKEKMKEIENDLYENPDKYNCGTYFVVFKYISMRDKIYSFFPTNFSAQILMKIKYFFQNILCGCCTSEKTKRTNYIKNSFMIQHATEAYEVLWQNLGYSFKEKYFYLLISVVVTIVLIGISLCIAIALNEAQYKLTENEEKNNFLKYFLSFLISISIAIINSLARKILKKITKNFEATETKTDYFISISIKISLFTFINTAIIPLASNYIRHKWGNNDILINNILLIFITNITITPFVFYFAPPLWLKLSRRAKARLDLEGISLVDSNYTQGELNKIFENPSMDLSYKYSFLTNILLTSLFYMSIFPLGAVFSLVSLILCYFLEIFYLGFYRRPEVLNERLCKYFIQNFKIVVSVFCIGNFIFLSSINEYYRTNWSLINLILFIIIAFVPYHSVKINFLGVTEGETSKGSYDDYALMFPTDYEKENPLTKKKAMIAHFKKLREMNLIDKTQCEYLIKDIQKESVMDNYYKSSKYVGKVLSSYEFQRQFLKLKKKYKFIREVRRKKSQLDKYDIDEEFLKRGLSSHSRYSIYKQRRTTKRKITNISNNINDDESNLGYNENYNMSTLIDGVRNNRKRQTSKYMRQTLFKRIKDEGIYSESEEESEEESEDLDSFDNTSRKKEIFDFDHSSMSNHKEENINDNVNANRKININDNDNGKMNTIKEESKNEEDISSSVDTEYREYVRNLKKKGFYQNENNNNIQINNLNNAIPKRFKSNENIPQDTMAKFISQK